MLISRCPPFNCECSSSEEIRVAWLYCRVYFLPVLMLDNACMCTVCVYLYQSINLTLALNCLLHCQSPSDTIINPNNEKIVTYKNFTNAGRPIWLF